MQLLKRQKFVLHENNLRGESICPISEVKCLTCCLYSIKCVFKCHLRGKTYFAVDVQFTDILELADKIIFHLKLKIIIKKIERTHYLRLLLV